MKSYFSPGYSPSLNKEVSKVLQTEEDRDVFLFYNLVKKWQEERKDITTEKILEENCFGIGRFNLVSLVMKKFRSKLKQIVRTM